MNKNQRSHRKSKPNGLLTNVFKLIILLSLTFGINSCKKDVLVPQNKQAVSDVKYSLLPYKDFLSSVNLNHLGVLKSKLQNSSNGAKLLAINDNSNLSDDLIIYTDSVQKFTNSEGSNYVFKMALSSPRAISFRNLTIRVNKNGTTSAFIATYTPSKAWRTARKKNKFIAYDGDVVFNEINLASINMDKALSWNSQSSSANTKLGGNNIKQMQTVCYDYYVTVLYPRGCSSGNHMPWDMECDWVNGRLTPGPDDIPAGYNAVMETRIQCYDYWVQDPPLQGGGGTSPNPPGDYDPCDTDPPAQTSIKKSGGFSLQALPPNPCDGNGGGGMPPNAVSTLINDLQITDESQRAYLSSNTIDATALYNYLSTNGWTSGNTEFIYWSIAYLTENPNEEVANLLANRASIYYTNAEMEGIINSMSDPLTGNGIEFYLVIKYQGSKLFDLSRYDKAGNSVQVGPYTLTPSYSKNGILLFYSAYRNSSNGIEYIVRANQLNSFTSKVEFYTSAANFVYLNGIPSYGAIQIMSGDRIDGLLNLWSSALRSVDYWLYLANIYFVSSPNSVARTRVINTLKTDVASGYTFTNTAASHLDDIVTRGAYAGQLARPYMNSPLTVSEIMATGSGTPDASFVGGLNWRVPGNFRGSTGTWELGINPQTKVIYHFNFTN